MFYTETETPDKHSRKRGPESQDEATLAKPVQQSSSSIETYLTYLKGVYSVKQLPSDEKYSIECVEHFVNLECADVPKRITKKEAEEFRYQIVHGDIDGIEREKIDMDQVAVKQDDCYPKLVLVKVVEDGVLENYLMTTPWWCCSDFVMKMFKKLKLLSTFSNAEMTLCLLNLMLLMN